MEKFGFHFYRLRLIDFRAVAAILLLMGASLLVIGSFGGPYQLKQQLRWFAISSAAFILAAAFDYHKLREWAWVVYLLMLLSLAGLFFVPSIQRVHRWYRVPLLGMSMQPSETAKVAVVIALSWFLERRKESAASFSTAFWAALIVGLPFLLILKQPDLGSALVLFPMTLVIFYYGDLHPLLIKTMAFFGAAVLAVVALFFSETLSHEDLKPVATRFIKEYQYERLNPDNHHQKASQMAIALGGWTGSGWKKSEYTAGGWLPKPYTDSVFPAFGEEFGFLGLLALSLLFYFLLYFSFQVTAVAKDHFGRLLSAGISVYLAMHILVNLGMMCGILPITGVPLILVTYGGSSVLSTMTTLGILQSIYCRRFMFSKKR